VVLGEAARAASDAGGDGLREAVGAGEERSCGPGFGGQGLPGQVLGGALRGLLTRLVLGDPSQSHGGHGEKGDRNLHDGFQR